MAEDNVEKEQELRAQLRERFLRTISYLSGGTECKIRMFEVGEVTCQTMAFDSDFANVIVDKLQTVLPFAQEKAILRMGDIIYLQYGLKNFDVKLNKQ